jgi:hypothetical protein
LSSSAEKQWIMTNNNVRVSILKRMYQILLRGLNANIYKDFCF